MEMSPSLRPIVEAAKQSKLMENNINRLKRPLITSGEVTPDSLVPVIATGQGGSRKVFPMIWGYRVEGLNRPLFNARTETAMVKKSFADSWKEHRCIVPASWYFEWEHHTTPGGRKVTGQKYAIKPKETELTWLCGIYRLENNYPHFVILTREPGEALAAVHNRMPLIVPEQDVAEWIDPDGNAEEVAGHALTGMLMQKAG